MGKTLLLFASEAKISWAAWAQVKHTLLHKRFSVKEPVPDMPTVWSKIALPCTFYIYRIDTLQLDNSLNFAVDTALIFKTASSYFKKKAITLLLIPWKSHASSDYMLLLG